MKRLARLEEYLDAVTDAFGGDEELRLDVRAELAAHLDEAIDRGAAAGLTPEAAADEAIRALGPATDYAGDLVAANRPRMRLRGRARLVLRALVVPLSVAAALLLSVPALESAMVGNVVGLFGTEGCLHPNMVERWIERWPGSPRRLTAEQRLILNGDTARTDTVQRDRAIWEAWPTNVVYLNNYLTHLFSRYDSLGKEPVERLAALNRELDGALVLDPWNARYHYMRAAKGLELGAEIETVETGKNEKGESRSDYRLKIRDRAALDWAMSELLAGARKPLLRRYAADMLRARLAIMGPPRSMLRQIRGVSVAAGVMLPDISAMRSLARASVEYARLLVREGRPDDARLYLSASQTLAVQMADDSFTLIDVLVAGAIAGVAEEKASAVYRELGDDAAAERARLAAAATGAPVKAWRAKVKAANEEGAVALRRHAGILAGLLLPALGESVPLEDLAAGRLVEYALLDQMCCGLVTLVLLTLVFVALLASLRGRVGGTTGAPLLLLPDMRQSLRILSLGVLLPLGVYFAWTSLPLVSGRDYSLAIAWPAALAQAALLLLAIVLVTVTLARRAVRARCRTLELDLSRHPGTVARSLVPHFALAALLVSLLTGPALRQVESRLIGNDPLLAINSSSVGFTSVEARLVERLRNEMLAAARVASDGTP